MMTNDYLLQLCGVFQSGEVEAGSLIQRVLGSVRSDVILKDVSMEVRGGEVMAILGSKGSGKRVLLECIAGRTTGPRRGQVLLNHVPMNRKLFRRNCAYVTHQCDLVPGLTVRETLSYSANLTINTGKVSGHIIRLRVKHVMSDFALNFVANRDVDGLSKSEYRRLMIAVQVMRDPVVILLDEPAWDLDPLNTYFIISILSNHAKKYNRIVVLTMEKPRSDIFPFLDRVTYLCLGDIIYSGSTRMMLDYFRSIGFPCPELENPLMYYLCLSTVDRRSRERFLESNNQVASLVDRFRVEGNNFRDFLPVQPPDFEASHKMPLTIYGKPGNTSTLLSLMGRHYSCTFNFRLPGLSLLFLRLCVLPIYGFILWLFFFRVAATQTSFHTKNGLFFSLMAGISFIASSITALAYGPHRTRGYQEHREGGPSARVQAIAFTLSSIPLSLVSVFAASAIVYWGCGLEDDLLKWVLFSAALWAMYGFVEQQTLAIMLIVKCSFNAILVSFHFIIVYMAIASGTVRTLLGLPTWLYYLSYVIIYRYTGAFLFENEFHRDSFPLLPANSNFTGTATCTEDDIGLKLGCRYSNGTDFLQEKYHFPSPNQSLDDLNLYLNFGLGFAFYVGMIIVNLLIYSVPLPAFLKTKFRD